MGYVTDPINPNSKKKQFVLAVSFGNGSKLHEVTKFARGSKIARRRFWTSYILHKSKKIQKKKSYRPRVRVRSNSDSNRFATGILEKPGI